MNHSGSRDTAPAEPEGDGGQTTKRPCGAQ